jgi:hypothetical protein
MKTPVIINDGASNNNITPGASTTANLKGDTVTAYMPELREETSQPSGPNIVVIDGSLTYDNIQDSSKQAKDALDESLHTTSSQESLGLLYLLPKKAAEEAPESPKEALSFHASQVDSAELNQMELTTTENAIEASVESTVEYTGLEVAAMSEVHNLEVLVNVGNQLLQEETSDEMKPTKSSCSYYFKLLMLALTVFAVLGRGVMKYFDSSPTLQPFEDKDLVEIIDIPTLANIATEEMKSFDSSPTLKPFEDKDLVEIIDIPTLANIVTEEMKAFDSSPTTLKPFEDKDLVEIIDIPTLANNVTEEEEPSLVVEEYTAQDESENEDLSSWTGVLPTALQMILFGLIARLALSQSSPAKSNESEDESSEDDEHKTSLVKKEDVVPEFDLSKYEELKVVELRELLRSRKCKTVGKKPVLIQRLAGVYKAELDTLTVFQLRPILKSKGCKQAGLKVELIRRLVEAGM